MCVYVERVSASIRREMSVHSHLWSQRRPTSVKKPNQFVEFEWNLSSYPPPLQIHSFSYILGRHGMLWWWTVWCITLLVWFDTQQIFCSNDSHGSSRACHSPKRKWRKRASVPGWTNWKVFLLHTANIINATRWRIIWSHRPCETAENTRVCSEQHASQNGTCLCATINRLVKSYARMCVN